MEEFSSLIDNKIQQLSQLNNIISTHNTVCYAMLCYAILSYCFVVIGGIIKEIRQS